MAYTSYREARNKIANRKPFKGKSLSATLDGDIYTVFSYNTPIARASLSNDTVYVVTHRYSVTTSKHQTYVRIGFRLDNIIEVPTHRDL